MSINLMTTEFASSGLLAGLPKSEELFYQGCLPPDIQKYKLVTGGAESLLLSAQIIRKEETLMWEGARDLLLYATKEAAARTRGIYSFDLLAFSAEKELKTFDAGELIQVLFKSSLTLRPGGEILIKYSSVYGILRKLVDESWGKITCTTAVEVLPDEPKNFYLLLGRLLKKAEPFKMPVTILVHDLSHKLFYDAESSEQRQMLDKIKLRQSKVLSDFVRDVYVNGGQASLTRIM